MGRRRYADVPSRARRSVRITGVVSRYVGDAARQSSSNRIVVVVVGLYALYLASVGVVRAVRAAHLLAWRMPAVRLKGSFKAALWFAGGTTAIAVVIEAVNAIRQSLPGLGTVLLVVSALLVGGFWLAASWVLPHPHEVTLLGLLPGAIVFAVGAGALHLVTVLWYANKIAHSSELYGGLGAAAGLLAWLYLIGRLAMASAVINATLWRRKAAAV